MTNTIILLIYECNLIPIHSQLEFSQTNAGCPITAMSNRVVIDKSIQVNTEKYLPINDKEFSDEKNQPENDETREIVTREEATYLSKVSISIDAELIDYKLQPYSEEKIGFLGTHQKLIMEARKAGDNEDVKKIFFVKSMPYDVPLQAAYALEKNAYAKEIEFFRRIEPLMKENYKGEPWTPLCYLAKEDVLILEDMKLKGFANRPRILDEESLMSAVACVARFHASSLLAEERLNGKPLNKIYPTAFEESEYTATGRKYLWFTTAINYAISVAKDNGFKTNHIFEASKRVFDIAVPSKNKRNVAIHGDLWSSNLLFDAENHCRLVDFQMLRYAPPGQDLMQLLYLCTLRNFREKRENDVLQHYYKNLKESLEMNSFKGVIPSFEEIRQGANEQKFPALVAAVINFPTIMIDGKIGAKIMNDSNAYEEYFFRDRKPIVDQIIAMDNEYGRKIKNIVQELAEMCFKVDNFPRVQ